MELIITGGTIDAERAWNLGLVNRLTEPGEALATAVTLATTVASNGPFAVRTSKRIVQESAVWPDNELFERQKPFVDAVRSSHDAQEGARAFIEKRAPAWQGR
jgi:enoyl-CoA hydratase